MKKLALFALVLLAACTPKPGGEVAVPQGTPVILISVDTLRADRLPFYGFEGVETPALSALRRDAILYERAYAVTPLTFPSHATLLSGVLPVVHGVRDNVGYVLDKGRIEKGELPYLPRLLQQAGYATGGAVSSFVLQRKTGISTGFDFYEDGVELRPTTGLGGQQRPGQETLKLALDWLRSSAGKPFFFFFHIYEPHTPYAPPEPFASRYADQYVGEVAAADAIVGELLDELKRLEVYDQALVVFLSDHGEGLGDHGEAEHGVLLHREAIHVPLLLKLPKGQRGGSTVAKPAALIDVAPTVLSLLGLERPAPLAGVSLVGLMDEGAPERRIYSETFYPRLHFGWSELFSLIDARHHYIEGPDPDLFDLIADPAEKTDILEQERRVYADLRKELAGFSRELAPPGAVDEETRQAMAALGYISGGSAASDGPLPDPKEKLGTLADLQAGFDHMGRKDFAGAVAAFRKVLADNPKMVDAWEFLARGLERLGRSEEALAAYREALKISGGAPHLAVSAASLYFALGRLEDAEAHARMALATNASFAHGLLAQIALQRKQLDAAEREARLSMEDQSQRVGPLITLGEVLHAKGDLRGALDSLRKAEEAYGRRESKDVDLLQGLELVRGKVLADQGDASGAEAAFRKEIERFPEGVRAYSSLAILYALAGKPEAVGPILKAMVDGNPTPFAYGEAVKTLRILKDEASAANLLRAARGRFPDSTALKELEGRG